jgi:hypothetical protein
LKKLIINLFLLTLFCQPAEAQVKNILLDPNAYEPSVSVNRDDVQNIVASSAPDNIYYTRNGGLSWEKTKLVSTYGAVGNITLIADFKNNFYCLLQVRKNGKSNIVIQQSADGGKTWSKEALISSDSTKYAINPKAALDRSGNLFVTWTDFDIYESDNDKCISRVLLSRSSNGKKWSKPMELSQTHGNCKNDDHTPAGAIAAVMGGGQRAFAAWANQGKIFFDRAFDGGATWLNNDLAIAEQGGGWSMQIPGVQKANGLPMLLIDNTKRSNLTGALYMVWADQLRGENDSDIWFTRSLNFGDNWNQPIRINNDGPGKHQYLPFMAFDSETGCIYILYYDRRNYINENTDVFVAYSKDGGASFKNVKISETPFVADATTTAGNYIGIAAHEGVITPIWTRTENGKSSVWISTIKHADLENIK